MQGMSQLQMNMSMNMFNPLMCQMNMGGMVPPHQMYNPMLGVPIGFNLPFVPTMSNLMDMDPLMMGTDPSLMAAHRQAMAMAKHAYQMAVAQQAIAAAGDEWERSNNMGYNSVPRAPTMHGTPPRSAYGEGSLLGAGGQAGTWGGSAYGDAFGPAPHQHDQRQMAAVGGDYGSSLEDANSRTQGGKRRVTFALSASPPAHPRGDGAPTMQPPSS